MNSHVAFKVVDFLYLQGGWQQLELSDDIPLTEQILRPADGTSCPSVTSTHAKKGLTATRSRRGRMTL